MPGSCTKRLKVHEPGIFLKRSLVKTRETMCVRNKKNSLLISRPGK